MAQPWKYRLHLTQFLPERGGYHRYSYCFGHDHSVFCPECLRQYQDPDHILLMCRKFASEREQFLFPYMWRCRQCPNPKNHKLCSGEASNVRTLTKKRQGGNNSQRRSNPLRLQLVKQSSASSSG